MNNKLIVLGSINADHVLNVAEFPKPGETLVGHHYKITFGGKGANQAVAAGRAGANIQFIAAVGNDSVGLQICEQLEKDGIDVHSVKIIDQEKTGVALIFVDTYGENEIGIYPGANAAVTTDFLTLYQQDIINADAILIQLEIPLSTIEKAIKLAKQHQTKVIVNPAPAQLLSDEILKNIDIIIPNETEAESLTGIKVDSEQDANNAANYLHQKGINIVIITLGSKGAWVSVNGKGELIAAYCVNAIDTTAAGDTFIGMLVTALLENKSLHEAIKYAHAAAAIAVTRPGAQTAVPWRKEVELFMTNQ